MKTVLVVALILLLPQLVLGSSTHVNGVITDLDGNALPSVKVQFKSESETVSATSKNNGTFSLELKYRDEHTITVDDGWALDLVKATTRVSVRAAGRSFESETQVGDISGPYPAWTPAESVFFGIPVPSTADVTLRVTRGPISGQVTSRGHGLSGITVKLYDLDDQELSGGSAVTDTSGNWKVPDVRQSVYGSPQGEVKVGTRTLKYQFESDVGAAPGKLNTNFKVTRGPIAGRVVGADGTGISGVTVELTSTESDNRSGISKTSQTTTGQDGVFAFENLSTEGTFRLTATKPGFNFGASLERRFVGETNLKIQLKSGMIGVLVHHPNGKQGGPINVSVFADGSQRKLSGANVSPETEFKADRLPPGRYRFEAYTWEKNTNQRMDYAPVIVSVGATGAELNPPLHIRGTVGSSGKPLAGITIKAQVEGDDENFTWYRTGSNGHYLLTNLKAGTNYQLSAKSEQQSESIVVSPAFPPGLADQFELRTSLSQMNFVATRVIRGRITARGHDDEGIAGITVAAGDKSGTTDDDGNFQIPGFDVDDRQLVDVHPSRPGMRFFPETVKARPGATNVLIQGQGGVTGRILYKDGTPAAEVKVDVSSAQDINFAAPKTATTDRDGRYFVPGTEERFDYTVKPSRAAFGFQPSNAIRNGRTPADFRVSRSPPVISSLPDQFAGLSGRIGGLSLTISDRETDAEDLKVFKETSDESILPAANIELVKNGEHVALSFATGTKTGMVEITVSVQDADFATSSTTFIVAVGLAPTYRIVDLGALPGQVREPKIIDLNENGEVLASAIAADGKTLFGVYKPAAGRDQGRWLQIDQSWSPQAMNDKGHIALGDISVDTSNLRFSFRALGPHAEGGPKRLFTPYTALHKEFTHEIEDLSKVKSIRVDVKDINNAGDLVVQSEVTWEDEDQNTVTRRNLFLANERFFQPTFDDGYVLVHLGNQNLITKSRSGEILELHGSGPELIGVNDARYALIDQPERIYEVSFAGRLQMMGRIKQNSDGAMALSPGSAQYAGTIAVPGWGFVNGTFQQMQRFVPFIGNHFDGTRTTLPYDEKNIYTIPTSINDKSEVVGFASTGVGSARPFYFRKGQSESFDLNDLLVFGTRWSLESKTAGEKDKLKINNRGEIVGIGIAPDGSERAFKAVPVVVVGRSVPRPQGTVAAKPDVVPATAESAFQWSETEKKFFAIRPVSALLRWRVSSDQLDENRVDHRVETDWPRMPQMHVVGTPVDVQPSEVKGFPYACRGIVYQEHRSAAFDLKSHTFTTGGAGYSVLHYVETEGDQLNQSSHKSFYQVVRSLPADSPEFIVLSNSSDKSGQSGPLNVGEPLRKAMIRKATIGEHLRPMSRASSTRLQLNQQGIEFYARQPGQRFDNITISFRGETHQSMGQTALKVTYDKSKRQLLIQLDEEGVSGNTIVDAVNVSDSPISARRLRPYLPDFTHRVPANSVSGLFTYGGWLEHDDYADRTGFVLNLDHAPVDAVGEDAAYKSSDRTGNIIPVNEGQIDVVWYRRNSIGVAWPDRPVRYDLVWPDDATEIVIADQPRDSAALPEALFTDAQVYHQPNRTISGFNPNEEHAFIDDQKVVALRSDINAIGNTSKSYALVKYRNPTTTEWQMRAFKVVAEDDTHRLHYLAQAGIEIQPPYPLNVLSPLCEETRGVFGPIWKDVKGKLYGYAAGPGGTDSVAAIRYYYPLQKNFYTPPTWNAKEGECVAWLNHYTGLTTSPEGVPARTAQVDPVDCLFTLTWPTRLPTMKLGSTLSTSRNGLPEITGQKQAEVLFESMNPDGGPDRGAEVKFNESIVRIYDPFSERSVSLPKLPDYLKTTVDSKGRKIFPGLPFHIQLRLLVDDLNPAQPAKLIFLGTNVDKNQPPGNPLLLPNIMSAAERDLIINLDTDGAQPDPVWKAAIDKLYNHTRNPNGITEKELDPSAADTVSTKLLTGMNRAYVVGQAADAHLTRELPPGNNANLKTIAAPESFGGNAKVLTTAMPPSAAGLARLRASVRPYHVTLSGSGANIDVGPGVIPEYGAFAVECWIRPTRWTGSQTVLIQKGSEPADRFYVSLSAQGEVMANGWVTKAKLNLNEWQHLAMVSDNSGARVLVNGRILDERSEQLKHPKQGSRFSIGGPSEDRIDSLAGAVREVRVWQGTRSTEAINDAMNTELSGQEPGLIGYWRCSEGIGALVFDRTGRGRNGALKSGAAFALGDAVQRPDGYVTLAFNNDRNLKGLPVSLEIFRIESELEVGDLRVLPSENVFDERLTLRHSNDYGGAVADFEFEWYYHRGSDNPVDGDKLLLTPRKANDGPNPGWLAYGTTMPGGNQITLGQGSESGLLVISDNRWMMRYRPKTGTPLAAFLDDRWSDWVGAPGLVPPEAQLAEGWIKRVTRALNPFDARTNDFRNSAVNTFADLLVSAGKRYEGPIAFNPDADNVNKIGLIEAYETVLRRGRQLSIDGAPPVKDDSAANQALLHAASKISDLYTLLGNEAYADAQDPTIGYSTPNGDVNNRAPSMFAFQNQLPSLLEEELALLRGIDQNAGAPAYNRLRWNMTGGDGQIAYVNVYNITDTETRDPVTGKVQPKNGFIDVNDAAFRFPQGHGDAWGQYLTSLTSYYRLLRHPNFQWQPRSESVLLGGTPIDVDFMDERKFAGAAAARARTGAEIVGLTYRQRYDSDAEKQFDGYPDPQRTRAWGVSEWARRAGQGAYFDWVVGNAILPDVDPDDSHVGIEKIDRTTVRELPELVATYGEIQILEDNANDGLNPLGLADGAIAFDINPNEVDQGKTQYEQIAGRATAALSNAVTVFNYANEMSRNLRRTQDSATDYASNVSEQEQDYTNRLIEIFGYPYSEKIGPGQPYASGYDGPDLIFYNYVDSSHLTGQKVPSVEEVDAYFNAASDQISRLDDVSAVLSTKTKPASTAVLKVTMPVSKEGWPFVASGLRWGSRKAPGEIQLAISGLLQAENSYRRSLKQYDDHLNAIDGQLDDLRSQYDLTADKLSVMNWHRDSTIAMNTAIGALHTTEVALNRTASIIDDVFETAEKAVPRVVGFSNDVTAPVRAAIRTGGIAATQTLEAGGDAAEVAGSLVELGKEQLDQDAEIKLFVKDGDAELSDAVGELEQLIRQEIPLRMSLFNQRELIQQAHARYLIAMQKGLRLLERRESFRRKVSGKVSQNRYRDMTFRVFRNAAIEKYRTQFDLAAKYVYLAARAYDYETTLLPGDNRAAARLFDDIIRERVLGEWADGKPLAGRQGLTSSIATLNQNFSVLKGQLGLNNRDHESGVFSLRSELFRIHGAENGDAPTENVDLDDVLTGAADNGKARGLTWRQVLEKHRVVNLWDEPVFRRHCRPFIRESAGPQPGIVIPFSTTVTTGQNLFGWPLGGNESSFDASQFATKIRSVGVVFERYPGNKLSRTPRVYLVPVGTDIMRSARGNTLAKREFQITDQVIPVPFPVSEASVERRGWMPETIGSDNTFVDVRRFSQLRAHGVPGEYGNQVTGTYQTSSSRLISRSVWNTRWMLIIPGITLSSNAEEGIEEFIHNVSDINLTLETYSSSGN